MPLDEAVDLALVEAARVRERPSPLTPRETEVAHLVARGMTNRQIADELVITERTAETHLERIFTKLDLRSRAQLTRWIVEREASLGGATGADAPSPRPPKH
jgi:non-specific serine/threonine protein kinase